MRIVMVKGFSKTGKTTTVTELAKELKKRGYSVGTVKDIHYESFHVDVPGTDTFKHMKSGARRVTALGPEETSVMADKRMDIDAVLKYYKEDFVLLEGDCGISCPVIVTGRTYDDIDKRMCREAIAISGVIADSGDEYKGLPMIDARKEVEKLADLVEKNTENLQEEYDVELTIGGETIWMVPFVKQTLKNVVTGAVKALDGYEDGKEIIIRIKQINKNYD